MTLYYAEDEYRQWMIKMQIFSRNLSSLKQKKKKKWKVVAHHKLYIYITSFNNHYGQSRVYNTFQNEQKLKLLPFDNKRLKSRPWCDILIFYSDPFGQIPKLITRAPKKDEILWDRWWLEFLRLTVRALLLYSAVRIII